MSYADNAGQCDNAHVQVEVPSDAGSFTVTFEDSEQDHTRFVADGEYFEEPWTGWAGWFGSSVSVAWVCNNAESVGASVVRGVELWGSEDEPMTGWVNLARVVVAAICGLRGRVTRWGPDARVPEVNRPRYPWIVGAATGRSALVRDETGPRASPDASPLPARVRTTLRQTLSGRRSLP